MTAILAYAAALPSLRLPAAAYAGAWGRCHAAGLKEKAFCAYDEDAVTLGAKAMTAALARLDRMPEIDALFLGATTLPYEEKPSAGSLATRLSGRAAIQVFEVRGSPQAGLQALALARDFCAAKPDRIALAIAADAPAAPVDAPYEHALGAGAAAFVVGRGPGAAAIEASAGITIETFGARFRRRGEAVISDLELRTHEESAALQALADALPGDGIAWVATGAPPRTAAAAEKQFGGTADEVWTRLGDAGAAAAPIALAASLDEAAAGDVVLAVALGAGGFAVRVRAEAGLASRRRSGQSVKALMDAGRTVDYVGYLRHRRVLSTRFGGSG